MESPLLGTQNSIISNRKNGPVISMTPKQVTHVRICPGLLFITQQPLACVMITFHLSLKDHLLLNCYDVLAFRMKTNVDLTSKKHTVPLTDMENRVAAGRLQTNC